MVDDLQTVAADRAQTGRRPIRFLTAACLVTAAVLLLSVWSAYDSYLRFGVVSQRALKIQELRGQILHLDEVLTMSARMAAATNDPSWEARYRQFEPQLGQAIEEAKALVPDLESTGQTDAANDALVALEEQAFDLVRGGRLEEARAILMGEQYATHKVIYAEGMERLGGQLDGAAISAARSQQERALLQLVGCAVALPLLLAGWWIVLRITDRWRRDIAESHQRLIELNRSLDQKVVDRTAALERATTAANAANEAKSRFLANMSHELRTPMNAIIGYTEILEEEAEDLEQEAFIPDLQKIKSAGMHLLALINNILDLSKIEAGKMNVYLERFGVERMVADVVSTVRPLVDKNANVLNVDCAEDLGEMRADLTKVRQVLFNLLSNAAKFTEGGTITLSAHRETRDRVEWVRLNVSDTGIGIPSDKLDHVFEEFSQADDSTSKNYGGTGLGLGISRRFCRMLGGDIRVESEPGVGSTFTIELPATAGEAPEVEGHQDSDSGATSAETTTPPILVVDDDANARNILRRSLEAEGHAVVTAPGGEEGLALAREMKPALITLDVMMAGMDGWSILQQLKAAPELQNIPVIMVTTVDGDERLAATMGAAEYLTKPVDRKRLLSAVSALTAERPDPHALVIEDDQAMRRVLRRNLEGGGWSVEEAENGLVGLERMAARVPDLVLLDLMMPIMDGFEFMERLRADDRFAGVPVVVLTAKDLSGEEKAFLYSRTQSVIQKGSKDREELLCLVGRLLAGSPRGHS